MIIQITRLYILPIRFLDEVRKKVRKSNDNYFYCFCILFIFYFVRINVSVNFVNIYYFPVKTKILINGEVFHDKKYYI